ncbi:Pyrroline-5-carboxylate reductase [bioreactor metagenome]|uniref:Pyrroline-5-carboxylate reductase n=1 Tax=bioreactor metagenome TaxID=1076179 RepID=A0A645HLS2_9ZZZZ
MEIEKFIEENTAVDQAHLSDAVKLAESAAALTGLLIEAITKAGTDNGIDSEAEARKIAVQAVFGSAKLIQESDEHPYALIDKVCSPAGTTIEGLLSLQKDGFEKKIIELTETYLSR